MRLQDASIAPSQNRSPNPPSSSLSQTRKLDSSVQYTIHNPPDLASGPCRAEVEVRDLAVQLELGRRPKRLCVDGSRFPEWLWPEAPEDRLRLRNLLVSASSDLWKLIPKRENRAATGPTCFCGSRWMIYRCMVEEDNAVTVHLFKAAISMMSEVAKEHTTWPQKRSFRNACASPPSWPEQQELSISKH